jgi:hypothetical protein
VIDSHVKVDASGRPTMYAGPDGVALFRVKVLLSSIKMYRKSGIIPTRGVGITLMMRLASEITGMKYQRGVIGWLAAEKDLEQWILAMQSAIPIEEEK